MDKPIRVQLSRRKGWRMPPNTVSVGQGPWLALFRACQIQANFDKSGGLRIFRAALRIALLNRPTSAREDLAPFADKNLACWCALDDAFCHADVLLELANAETGA